MGTLRFPGHTVDLATGRVAEGGRIRPKELALLRCLAERPGQAVDRRTLWRTVWGDGEERASVVDTTWYRLRKALGESAAPRHLITVPGLGLRLEGIAPTDASEPEPARAPGPFQVALRDRTVDLRTGEVSTGGQLRPAELAMFVYLAERAGSWVSLDELHARVWGYAPTAVSRTAYTAAARIRALIEADPARPLHLESRRATGYRLSHVAWGRATTALPEPAPLVGREEVLATLARDPAPQLWTLVGPPGVGKTAVARAHAWRCREREEVRFCEVHHAETAAEIDAELAKALQTAAPAGSPGIGPPGPAGSHGSGRPRLVVLDDLDRAGDVAGAVVERWRNAAPGVRFVCTRRRPLGIAGEHVVRIEPLSIGDGSSLLRAEVARRGARDRPTDTEAAALVSAVDGLPLGIELVAANVALAGAAGVLERLARGTHSLDASIRTSWDALSPADRRGLADLAVLDGPFALAAAEAVLDDPDPFDRLTSWVDASLLRSPTAGSYVLPTPIRAAIRRFEPIRDDVVLDRLLAVRRRQVERRPEPDTRFQMAHHASVSAVTAHRLLQRWDALAWPPDLAGGVAFLLVREAAAAGIAPRELLGWLDRALDRDPSPVVAAPLLYVRAFFARECGELGAAAADRERSAELARRAGRWSLAWNNENNRGIALVAASRLDDALALADRVEEQGRSLPAGSEADPRHAVAVAAFLRFWVGVARGEDELFWGQRSVAASRAAGREDAARLVEHLLPDELLDRGRVDEADELLGTLTWPSPRLDLSRCRVLYDRGRHDEIVPFARQLLARHASPLLVRTVSGLRLSLANLALRVGETDTAEEWLRERLAADVPSQVDAAERAICRGLLALVAADPAGAAVHLDAADAALPVVQPRLRAGLAVWRAEIRWAVGDLAGADAILAGADWGRTVVAVDPALLLAEATLRRGDPEGARALAERAQRMPTTQAGRGRSHALLATCAALAGDPDAAATHLRWASGTRGVESGWVRLHEGWVDRCAGRVPAPILVHPAAQPALAACARELASAEPAWFIRCRRG